MFYSVTIFTSYTKTRSVVCFCLASKKVQSVLYININIIKYLIFVEWGFRCSKSQQDTRLFKVTNVVIVQSTLV